jgi:hypothetical protein
VANPVKKVRNLLDDIKDAALEWKKVGIHGEVYLKYEGVVGYEQDDEGGVNIPVVEGVSVDYDLVRNKDQLSRFTLVAKVIID